jgi:hypothetical protein
LADVAGGGGAAEMAVVGEGDDVAEVLEGHGCFGLRPIPLHQSKAAH